MNVTNNQTAFEYALYMIAASYFNKVTCNSLINEKYMLLQYKEQKLDKQYQMEETCIRYMDELKKKFPKDFFQQNMNAKIRRHGKAAPTDIFFANDQYVIRFRGIYAGRKPQIEYRLWMKIQS